MSSFATTSIDILRTKSSTVPSGAPVAGGTDKGIPDRTPEGTRKNADVEIHHSTGEGTHDNMGEGCEGVA